MVAKLREGGPHAVEAVIMITTLDAFTDGPLQ